MRTNTIPRPQSHELRLLPIFAYAVPIFLASLIITGYRIYFHNQALQIPLIYLINEPTLYPNDPFAQTLPHYASLLWWPVAWISRLVPLETLFPIMFLVERALLMGTAAYLALTFAPRSRLAVVSAMAWFALGPLPILGGGTLITSYPEQTGLAIPFLLLSIAFFYQSRPIATAVAMAVAFNLNSMYATYALVYFAVALITRPEYRRTWKRWMPAVGLFLVLASPAIHLTVAAVSKPADDVDTWIAASLFRLPHHLYPSTWPVGRFVQFGLLLAVTVITLATNRNANSRLYYLGITWATTSLIWVGIADAAALLKSPALIVAQSARATDFWYIFAGIALTSTCSVSAAQPRYRTLAAAILFASLLYCTPYNSVVSYIALALGISAYHSWNKIRRDTWSQDMLLLVTGLVVLIAGTTQLSRQASNSKLIDEPDRHTMQMARWVQSNTPCNAVFLVNPNMGAFRALTQRPALVTWKDGSAILWDRAYAAEWVARMNAIGCDILNNPPESTNVSRELNRIYNGLSDSSVRSLCTRYHIDYWIVPSTRKSRFPTVYKNAKLKVLAIKRSD